MSKIKLSPEDKLMTAIFGKPLGEMTEEEKLEAFEKKQREYETMRGKRIGEMYTKRIEEDSESFAESVLEELKESFEPDEYKEMKELLVITFIAGANSARDALIDIAKMTKEGVL